MVYSYKDFLPLPGFENSFYIVSQENNAVTIIPKEKKEFKSRHYVSREKNILHKIKSEVQYV